MTPPVRKPYVAGSFYPAETDSLQAFLAASLEPALPLRRALALVLPHAGYIYSGKTAAEVVRRVEIPEVCFLVGPNHEGVGSPFALIPEGAWETPLGLVSIDRDGASRLLEASHDLAVDWEAHEREHSLEVEVPFLRYRNPKVRIIPLILGTTDVEWTREVALALAESLKRFSDFLIVASTDLTHYESDEATRRKDRYALEAIEALDEEKLAKAVHRHRVTMCGFMAVYLTLVLGKALGAKKASLVDYRTSAEASGDYERVVGYAGFIIE